MWGKQLNLGLPRGATYLWPAADSPQKSHTVLGHKAFNFSLGDCALGPELGRGVFQARCWLALSLGDSEKRVPFLLQMTGSSLKTRTEASGHHSTLSRAQCSPYPAGLNRSPMGCCVTLRSGTPPAASVVWGRGVSWLVLL